MNKNLLNESIIRKDLSKCLNEDRPSIKSLMSKPRLRLKRSKENKRPEGVSEWTFADWFGEDLTNQTYNGNIDCSECELTSLEGAPKEVGGNFDCDCNQLTSLEGAPVIVNGHFYCSGNQLTSLEGAPKEVGKDFHCRYNRLTSLEGAPKEVGGWFVCFGNQLTSLKGAPEKINKGFSCTSNRFISLEGAPKEIGGRFHCDEEIAKKFAKELKEKNYKFDSNIERIINRELRKCLNENANDVYLGNGWKLIKPEMGDGVGDNMYYFVAIEGITCKYADPELDDSFYEFCDENGIDPDDISIIGINGTKGAVGTYCKGGKKGGVNWDSAIESAKMFIEKYQTIKKWMDDNGMKTDNKRLVVYAIDEYAHNF